jgi:hypothetical protein
MDLSALREWLIDNGVSAEELDNVEPHPLVVEVQALREENAQLKQDAAQMSADFCAFLESVI